ncbi:unnamed protein product [Pleuronectes platessa]|uniref:Uncharacterized protein n=1 Tax=Pleuronectes platessa TaxID=8262 RepID=A0A9N7V7F7_PLEPL|nr:unnamed protein product [Pleuronectes platessa]
MFPLSLPQHLLRGDQYIYVLLKAKAAAVLPGEPPSLGPAGTPGPSVSPAFRPQTSNKGQSSERRKRVQCEEDCGSPLGAPTISLYLISLVFLSRAVEGRSQTAATILHANGGAMTSRSRRPAPPLLHILCFFTPLPVLYLKTTSGSSLAPASAS